MHCLRSPEVKTSNLPSVYFRECCDYLIWTPPSKKLVQWMFGTLWAICPDSLSKPNKELELSGELCYKFPKHNGLEMHGLLPQIHHEVGHVWECWNPPPSNKQCKCVLEWEGTCCFKPPTYHQTWVNLHKCPLIVQAGISDLIDACHICAITYFNSTSVCFATTIPYMSYLYFGSSIEFCDKAPTKTYNWELQV